MSVRVERDHVGVRYMFRVCDILASFGHPPGYSAEESPCDFSFRWRAILHNNIARIRLIRVRRYATIFHSHLSRGQRPDACVSPFPAERETEDEEEKEVE